MSSSQVRALSGVEAERALQAGNAPDSVRSIGESNAAAGAALTGRILLAEDDGPLRRAYVRALGLAGHQVIGVPDGLAAAELIAAQSFDVVISDIAMPKMGGMQLLRHVREHDLDVPVLLITATPSVETAAEAVEHGALRYLVKPFALAELMQTVQQALGLHRIARLKRQLLKLSAHDHKLIGDRIGLELGFERALRSLRMVYQPIVSWSTHRIVAYEALLRTQEPSLEAPESVLAAAERLGRVHQVGRQVRDQVARMAARAPDATLFVNLHVHDLLDPELYSPVAALAPFASRIVLEVTERASLDQVPNAREQAQRLRKLGYRIALDDLGAGYAGLGSFAQLEPDIAKLDMSLTRNVHREATRRALVRSMVSVCHELGIGLIAEGIETADERDALLLSGCDLLQGFLFGRPHRELLAARM
jgi:EAL domain-containing protein (putative c-di-GMP-specific phosphodiesterase class I)